MTILPFKQVFLTSPLAIADARQAVTLATEPVPWIRVHFDPSDLPFEGRVRDSSFCIQPNPGGGFLPKICGSITPSEAGTRITIRTRPPVGATVFLAFPLCMVGAAIKGVVFEGGAIGFLLFVTLLAGGAGLWVLIPYQSAVEKAIDTLRNLVQGTLVAPTPTNSDKNA